MRVWKKKKYRILNLHKHTYIHTFIYFNYYINFTLKLSAPTTRKKNKQTYNNKYKFNAAKESEEEYIFETQNTHILHLYTNI